MNIAMGGAQQRTRAMAGGGKNPADRSARTARPHREHALFRSAGLSPEQGRHVLLRAGGLAAVAAAAALFTRHGLLLLLAPLILLFELRALHKKVLRRAERFERDYPAFLLALASSVRTGLDPLAALLTAVDLFSPESEIHKQLLALRKAIEDGLDEEQAIRGFAASVKHPDIALFRIAFILARREGSSLAECLQRLARVTRQRQSFRRKIRGAIAMQKLSSIGIAGCAIVIGLIQVLTNPDAIKTAVAHPVGIRALTAGLALIALGLAWMMQMSRTRV